MYNALRPLIEVFIVAWLLGLSGVTQMAASPIWLRLIVLIVLILVSTLRGTAGS